MLTKPGLSLDEVKAELRASRQTTSDEERRARRHALVDEVTAAWTDEAAEVVEHDHVEMCRKVVAAKPEEKSTEEEGSDGVELRHRFDPRPKERSRAKRIVTLRDRRRGRPRRPEKQGGSEPPR